ncbi:MAG: transporter [Betaproteobacteria bacterium]|nr:transporter [Betaproteobacteria bacterium]
MPIRNPILLTRRVGATLVLLACGTGAYAAHPYLTDDTGTQGKGNWQLELTAERGRDAASADLGAGLVRQESSYSQFAPVLTYGLLDNLDIALGGTRVNQRETLDGVLANETAGRGDSSLELKWRFYESGNLSLALKPGISLPTGDEQKGLGSGKTSWAANLILTYETKPWTLLANLAYQRARFALPADEAASRAHLWRASAGFAYGLAEGLRLAAEAGVSTNPARNDPFSPPPAARFAMLGIIYSPTDKMDFDLGLRKGLNRGEIDSTLLAGATFRW